MSTVLSARDLQVRSGAGPIVTGVDLDLHAGTTLAVVGESGSGKSMVAKALSGLLPRGVHATGQVELAGAPLDLAGGERTWAPVRGRQIALLLQDPFTSLSPVHRCGPQVAAALPGTPDRAQRRGAVAAALAEVGLDPDVARRYPFELSGGMRQRVAIAAALAAGPQVLLADEPTTALDVTTQRAILDLIGELRTSRGMAVVLITHDLELARERADDLVVLYAGRVLETGPARDVMSRPAHPYTKALHEANPPLEHKVAALAVIEGNVPRPAQVAGRCVFADRCPKVQDVCREGEPALVDLGAGRGSACLFAAQELAAAPTAPELAPPVLGTDRAAPVVQITGLSKTYAGATTRALDDVNLLVGAGECVGVVGESGSGKTTLARCLVGLERADGGQIRFLGPLTPTGDPAGRPAHRLVQIVFQDPYSALDPALSIGATLAEALAVGGRPRTDVPELLDLVGLPATYARRRPHALSGGERQRVAIARALAPGPSLLVCDESVSALDVSVQAQVLNLLHELRARLGLSLVFISHDMAVVRQMADHVYVMLRGRVVEDGPTDQVLSRPAHDYTRALMASVPGRATQEQ
ncbi:ABC transporter ATP-binding protein [Cellulomonas citrea]|uniref:ABC transporter ATP-binding protein n=1 Tax=Cellulomonas citrea TaxID=1909423 RepID=UPI00135B3669|nr:ABC transporter ATP-binding protein [Cellulomonas citrea]